MSERTPVLVLGLGNVVCQDDGAGIAAIHKLLREYELPEGVLALDGGTLGLSLLPLVDSADQVIMVDAIRAEGPPGTLVRIEGDEVAPAVYERLSPHQIGVADLLAGASLLDRYPNRVVLIGVVPKSIDLGLGRTEAVEASIPELVERVVEELRAIGYPPVRRLDRHENSTRSVDHVARTLGV
ncbi:MAG: HyaD/HybD family hydrogenase maturation endopeptidase [Myxococcales bacterium]|nr:HyaD/HybD family hydrogenase maturation endopeptidase [Myxococcales bacterium]MDH3843878.1 HyaD/HybD family hydrogenase maturation endopeptidase [Myxococcales bacterium]